MEEMKKATDPLIVDLLYCQGREIINILQAQATIYQNIQELFGDVVYDIARSQAKSYKVGWPLKPEGYDKRHEF